MARKQNGKLTKYQVDKMSSGQNVKLTKCCGTAINSSNESAVSDS